MTSDYTESILVRADLERRLVVARLSTISSDVRISLGNLGAFSACELIQHIEEDDEVGKKIVEIQMAWLRSWKDRLQNRLFVE